MTRFDRSFFTPGVQYLANSPVVSRSGGVGVSSAAPVNVAASVQRGPTLRFENPEGVVEIKTTWEVYLFDDPAPLNGGKGVSADDRFSAPGYPTLIAQGVARKAGAYDAAWLVPCLAVG